MSVLFKNHYEQRELVDRNLTRFFPRFKTGGFYFREYLKNYAPKAVILDAGCGRGGQIGEFKNVAKEIIGLDIDERELNQNSVVDKKIKADLTAVPLPKASVDIVSAEFVLEHLRSPAQSFSEIYRVLKPDGVFIFLTPNVLNPVMFFSKITPVFLHRFFKRELLKKEEIIHKTYYRANTYRRLFNLGRTAGFSKLEIQRAGNPDYFAFLKPLVLPAILFEKALDNQFLEVYKMYLIGCFKK